MDTNEDIWIFGYGSLVWKTNFAYTDSQIGHIKCYKRRFWQGSSDHRGTHTKPGRVATILPTGNPEDQVFGRAYKLDKNEIETTFSYLNHREKNGYELKAVLFYPRNLKEPFTVPIYISSESNPHFLGEAPLEEMAEHIFSSTGPSGANLDYFLNLLDFMSKHAPEHRDEHLSGLEKPIRRLMEAEGNESNCNNCALIEKRRKEEIVVNYDAFTLTLHPGTQSGVD